MTHSGTLIRICIDSYLTLIYNSLELILYLSVKNFTKVFCSETCCKSIIADTDTEHIPLSCVIYTFNAVYIIVEFTLDNRFKIRLHLLTSYFYHVGKAVLASRFEAIDFRTYDSNLVILDLVHFLSLHKLYAVHTGTVKFHTHIFTTNDLTFKGRRKCYRNIHLCDLDLDSSCFKGNLIKVSNVRTRDQGSWYFHNVLILIGDYRETKLDRTSTGCKNYIINRFESIYKCRNPVFGVCKKACCIARCYIAEDQCCTKCNRYNVDNRCYVFSQRNNS